MKNEEKEKKTQVDAVTTDNSSPLYIACQHGHLEVVKYLCSKGANSEIRVRMICVFFLTVLYLDVW